MKHPVSGEVEELSEEQFLSLFDAEVRDTICERSRNPGVEAMVCFECIQLDSPMVGNRTALTMGPGCTYPLSEIEKGARLGSVPSVFQYPRYLWRVQPMTTPGT